jgi:hypothetical protein
MPMRRRPSRRSMPWSASSATRVRIRPTVRQATPSSSATAAWAVWTASHAACPRTRACTRTMPGPGDAATPRRAGGSALWARRPPTTPAWSQGPAPARAVDPGPDRSRGWVGRRSHSAAGASWRSHRRHDRVGLLIEADRFHDGVLDAEQPCPYLPICTPFRLSTEPALDSRNRSGGTACSHTGTLTAPTDGHKSHFSPPVRSSSSSEVNRWATRKLWRPLGRWSSSG